MAQKPVYLTQEGQVELEKELDLLRTARRKEIANKINQAKELGTTVNNAEYDDAKREQSFMEGRIRELETLLVKAQVVKQEKTPSGWVRLGSKVTVVAQNDEEEVFTIVGSAEVHPLVGKISNESPVGQALLGKRVGEEVQTMTPGGVVTYVIRTIE